MTSRLILGGARSGKSAFAEQLGAAHSGDKIYIATAEVSDAEMAERIRHHQARRGDAWQTVDAPLGLVAAIKECDARGRFILIDCITVWINNLIFHDREVEPAVDELCKALFGIQGEIVLVSNEVGFGIVPDNALARRFRDVAGRANQVLGATVEEVVLIVAGLPLTLKQSPQV